MEQIRIGMIGATGRGSISRHWHQSEGRSVVVGAMDTSQTALDWFQREINDKAFVTKDHRELLERPDIDAIAVTSPDYTHEQYVIDAFAAGKHVFSEKPMALTTEGCDRMLRAWVESGKQFMIGFNMRYMNLFRAMKDAIDSGDIGEVKAVWVRHFVAPGGGFYFHDWHSTRQNTNGLLLQKASHDIDVIHWLTGHYGKRVVGMGGLDYYGGDKSNDLRCDDCADRNDCVEFFHALKRPSDNKMNLCCFRQEVDVEDNSILMMELDNGIKATYMQCHFAPEYCRNFTVIGTEGRIENFDDHSKMILKMRNRSKRWKNLADRSYDVKPAQGGHGGADPLICNDFVAMLLDGKRPLATPLNGRMSVAVGCAATWSLRNGMMPMDVPPIPEDLVGKIY